MKCKIKDVNVKTKSLLLISFFYDFNQKKPSQKDSFLSGLGILMFYSTGK